METNTLVDFIKKHRAVILVSTIILVLLIIASRFSFITIAVEGQNPGTDITYFITDSAGKTSQTSSKETSYKKLVGRGEYSVSVSQGDKNAFALVSTGGFFLNKKVNANLVPEKSRTFVGNNPDACMSFSGTHLFSFSCRSTIKTLKVHLPATGSQSTFTKTLTNSGDSLEGLVRINEQMAALIRPVGGDQSNAPRLMTTMNQDKVDTMNGAYHPELSSSRPYELKHFRDGFIVLGEGNSSDLFYYKDLRDQGEKISLGIPKNSKLTRYAWGTSKDSVAVAYIDRNKTDAEDSHAETTHGTSTVMLLQDNKSKEVKVDGYFTDLKPCGSKKLCVLNGKTLQVYDTAGKNPKFLFDISDVQAIENTTNALLVATSKNILALDVNSKSGSIDYSYGSYAFCGMSADAEGYQLCVINEEQNKVALRIERNKENTDSIDKKIAEIQRTSAVSQISIYGKTINVIPNYGAAVYNPVSKIYEADKATINRVNGEFANELKRVGISANEYTITGLRQ